MPEIPPQAVQAAIDAFPADSRVSFEDRMRMALEAAAPLLAEQARAEERARVAAHLRAIPGDDQGFRTGTRRFIDRHERLHEGTSIVAVLLAAADEIEGLASPAGERQGGDAPARGCEAPLADGTASPRLLGSSDDRTAVEARTALRERYAAAIRENAGPGRTVQSAADAVLAVRDDVFADALHRAERAEEIVRVVRATTEQWAAKVPADDWGRTLADTVFADAGRIVLALIGPALDVPADGEQPPTPATEETDR